jgi:hypothetical protein
MSRIRAAIENAAARFGYVTRGVLYLMMGALVLRLALGYRRLHGETADLNGSLKTIAHEPFGRIHVLVIATGLFAFAAWRLVQAIADSDHVGRKPSAVAKRLVFGVTGLLYAQLAFASVRLILDGPHAVPPDETQRKLLLAWEYGPTAVVALACVLVGIGIGEAIVAAMATFTEELDLSSVSPAWRKTIVGIGRVGFAAHAAVFAIVGVFLFKAGLNVDRSSTKGVDSVLFELATEHYGNLVVIVIGAGLIVFGGFSFLMAKYRVRPR